jgi:ubiquinone/menaquinone biosynthesis C-methylase UbiE
MKDLSLTYDEIAEEWAKNRPDEWMQNGLDAFIACLNPGSTVLDIGCGSGDHAKYIQDKGMKVTGIDFSNEMIHIARLVSPDSLFQVLDATDLAQLDSVDC